MSGTSGMFARGLGLGIATVGLFARDFLPTGVVTPADVSFVDRYYAPRGPHHSVPAWVSPVQVAHERRMDRIHQQQAEDMAIVLAALAASEVI